MKLSLTISLLALSPALAAAQDTLLVPEQFATIQAAMAASDPGDLVSVGAGVYLGPIDFAGKDVRVVSRAGPEDTHLTVNNSNTSVVFFTSGETRAALLEGFTVRDGRPHYLSGGGIQIVSSSPTVRNCIVRDNNVLDLGPGIFVGGTGSAPLIQNCLMRDNTADWDNAGLVVYGPSSGAAGWAVIQNCTVVNNRALDPLDAYSSVIQGRVLVINSIFRDDAPGVPYDIGAFGEAQVLHTAYGAGVLPPGQAAPENGNTLADPGFTNPGVADYTLAPSSPLIDLGTTVLPPLIGLEATFPTVDLAGNPRIAGASIDIGAYEYMAGAQAFCYGDGSATSCPCNNAGSPGQGCANGGGSGAVLSATGIASVAADSLVLFGAQLIPGHAGLFLQGANQIAGGEGVVFGDGLRCVGVSVVRLEVRIPDTGGAASTTVSLGVAGGVVVGEMVHYQLWYRDTLTTPCGSGFNLTNALSLTWAP